MTETINLICYKCKHQNPFRPGCEAFPEGIPNEILLKNEHSKPLPQQTNKIIFEPSDEELKI